MKNIINNPNDLNISEIDIVTNKVRALIIDKYNNIIITMYADILMLPGGKIDKGETSKDAIIRELKEELGYTFNKNEIEPFLQYESYLKDYPIVGKDIKKNKLNNTYYFIIKTDKIIKFNRNFLTEREKNNGFEVNKINFNRILSFIINHKSNNPRNEVFKGELLKVLREYINREKIIDMHTHSIYSDGEKTPNELIKYAINNNIGTIAITDHDTIDGLKNIDYSDKTIINSGINIINGIELSSKVDKGTMHILGYNIDINNKKLNDKISELKNVNINYIILLLAQINKDYNIKFSSNDIKNVINSIGNIGRPDIAKICIKYGYAESVQDAFDKYLISAYDKIRSIKQSLNYQECISLIQNSCGIPVLAHPKTLKMNENELIELIEKMVRCGLKGIEVYHSTHSITEINLYLKIAQKYNLLISGGSDYHGKISKPDVEIGTGIGNNLKIKKLSLLNNIY